jgi:hypothetical protein
LELEHSNIKSMNVDVVLYYKDHKISYHRYNGSFMVTIEDQNKISDTHLVTDQNFNDCILDLLNYTLKPYINFFLEKEKN